MRNHNPFSDVSFDSDKKFPRVTPNYIKSAKKFMHSKSSVKLPNLNLELTSNEPRQNIKAVMRERKFIEGNDVLEEIEKKLKTVLEEQSYAQYKDDVSEHSDEDFQEKINKHRVLIKNQKIQRQNEIKNSYQITNLQINLPQTEEPKKEAVITTFSKVSDHNHGSLGQILMRRKQSNLMLRNKAVSKNETSSGYLRKINNNNRLKIDSLYEKRVRDYKEESRGNKYVNRKIENLIGEQRKNLVGQEKQHELQFGKGGRNDEIIEKSHQDKEDGDKKIFPKRLNHSISVKQHDKISTNPQAKAKDPSNLFENIHGILKKSQKYIGLQKPENYEFLSENNQKQRRKDESRKLLLQKKMESLDKKIQEQNIEDIKLIEEIERKSRINELLHKIQSKNNLQPLSEKEETKEQIKISEIQQESSPEKIINETSQQLSEEALRDQLKDNELRNKNEKGEIWRKITFNKNSLEQLQSNFDTESQRVNYYQEASARGLAECIENKTRLISLTKN